MKNIIIEWLIILFAPFILVGYFLQYPQQVVLHNYGLISYWLLVFIIFLPVVRSVPYLNIVLKTRKVLGLLAFYLAVIHSYFYWINHSMPEHLWNPNWTLFWGTAAMVCMTVLAMTSHESIKQIMGAWWFRLHKLIYLVFALTTLHIVLLGDNVYAYWVVLLLLVIRFGYLIFRRLARNKIPD